jgi:hypothetical protein
METFNGLVLLWQLAFVASIITFFYGQWKNSWFSMFISFITFLPIAYYFNGAENGWRVLAIIPFLLLLFVFVFWKKSHSKK